MTPCSYVAKVSLRHPLSLQLRWHLLAITTCSTVAQVSLRHPLSLQLRWHLIAITACSSVVQVSLRYPLSLQLRWQRNAIFLCSTTALVSNSRPLRLENTCRSIAFLLQERVQQQAMILATCSNPQVAPLQEHQTSTKPTISAPITW